MEGHENGADPESIRPAIEHLKEALAQGRNWVPALLESVALWTLPDELFREHHNRYLLDGEAFDWLLLAERLLAEVDGQVPEAEKMELLFTGDASASVSEEQFKELMGPQKHSAYLNYWYGVVVEEAVIQSAEEEEWKRMSSSGDRSADGVSERAFRRIYGHTQETLLAQFREEKGYAQQPYMEFSEAKEFTYWLFKHRVKNGEGARVASDTRKGIQFLRSMSARRR